MTNIAPVHTVANTSAGWQWIAVLIGLGVLALLYFLVSLPAKSLNPWKLVEGADGRPSTSKLQWFLWIVVVLWAYVALWVIRAHSGNYSAINTVPANLLTVLGFSTGTAAAAKGITSAYTNSKRITKPPAPLVSNADITTATATASTAANSSPSGGILSDDSGVPELAKIQMMGFTIIAIGIFLANVIHQIVSSQIASTPSVVGLPDIDSSLLVLMGISQGGYLGKKLVTFGTPILYAPNPSRAASTDAVTVPGASLGLQQPGSQLLVNDAPIATSSWTDGSIGFVVPANNPASDVKWQLNEPAQIKAVVGGQQSNTVTLVISG
jgi:hypothetical protein